MFSRKYANDIKPNVKSAIERKLNFAKLYLIYKDYDTALNNIHEYLKCNDDSAVGHKVLAQIYEAMGESEKALDSYQKSLQYDCKQDDVLMKICKLLISHPCDVETLRFWVEKAEKAFPRHNIVAELKECVEDVERLANGHENSFIYPDKNSSINANNSFYYTPLSERFSNSKLNATLNQKISAEKFEEKLNQIAKKQEELLKSICDRQDLLLKSNNEIVEAIKEGNENFKSKLDKIHSTLEEIYLLKNLSFSKKQEYSGNLDLAYSYPEGSNVNMAAVGNVNASNTYQTYTIGSGTMNDANKSKDYQEWPTATNTTVSMPKDTGMTAPKMSSAQDFSMKFQSDITEAFQKAIHGAKGFNDSNGGSIPLNEMFRSPQNSWACHACFVDNSGENFNCISCETPKGGTQHIGTVNQSTDLYGNSMTPSGLYPQALFPTASKTSPSFFQPPKESNFDSSKTQSNLSTIGGSQQIDNRPLSEVFKTQPDNWQCQTCYVSNSANDTTCVACETPKPGSQAISVSNNQPTTFKFGIQSSTTSPQNDQKQQNNLFKFQPSGWQCQSCCFSNPHDAVACVSCEVAKPGSQLVSIASSQSTTTFKFGTPVASTPLFSKEGNQPTFKFEGFSKLNADADNTGGFTFGENLLSKQNSSSAEKTSPSKPFSFTETLKQSQSTFQFGSSQNFSFKFGGVLNTSPTGKSLKQPHDVPNSPEYYQESPEHSNDDSMHFKPLIPLPPKIEVKTGEEDETVLFDERAKLYRFVSNEWKERGIGEIKILHDSKNNRIRLLMRRDQVLKVCLNHCITKDLKLNPKGNVNEEGGVKSFQWSAVDYSEGVPNSEVFAIKFKNCAIAENFRKVFEDSKMLLDSQKNEVQESEKQPTDGVIKNTLDSDLEIIYERPFPPKEIEGKLKNLKLPINFYDYEKAKPCPGCRGCEDKMPKLLCEIKDMKNQPVEDTNSSTQNLFSAAIAAQGTASSWTINTSGSTPSWLSTKLVPVFKCNDGKDFKPVIPLPDLVEVKTGEEDETPVFSQRAKLYRYDPSAKQWKERGVGDFKILKHDTKKRYRLLLRRDQVLKIACNHYLSKSLNFTPMANSETAVCWFAVDYSEENPVSEKFAVKFKNKAILNEFLEAIEVAKQNIDDAQSGE
ncbi:hypothetical protein B4U79_12289 [Dinothrombium tinctorium]|uniref:Nuclear pore complex protein Nup153 n=1 Tax=Dinothrombium tinctorium TaxID=1965070 RepID=A0A443RAD3_9ACAR|nr:hypothetical protein B4U79_12289 [Dinothrombium tinctorium]